MENYRICNRCVMDNASDDSITFNEDGTCNYCNDVITRKEKEYFPNMQGRSKLNTIIQKIKDDCKNKPYDCMVGLSGGVDSSYVLYLGYRYRLRMLAIHIDDGYDTEEAVENIKKLCRRTNTELISIKPDMEQYNNLLLAFFKAGVPNVAIPQDNILFANLIKYSRENRIKYFLNGANFAHESILQRGCTHDAYDTRHIKGINNEFGSSDINKLDFISMFQNYIAKRYLYKMQVVYPLNYIEYNLNHVLKELAEFADFKYYGGKHYESILTRFMQCYYLPEKFNFDKRKSHYSSLIMDGQMSREEALDRLNKSPYVSNELLEADFNFIANKLGIGLNEFKEIIDAPKKQHREYPVSRWNLFAGIARKLRLYLG